MAIMTATCWVLPQRAVTVDQGETWVSFLEREAESMGGCDFSI